MKIINKIKISFEYENSFQIWKSLSCNENDSFVFLSNASVSSIGSSLVRIDIYGVQAPTQNEECGCPEKMRARPKCFVGSVKVRIVPWCPKNYPSDILLLPPVSSINLLLCLSKDNICCGTNFPRGERGAILLKLISLRTAFNTSLRA